MHFHQRISLLALLLFVATGPCHAQPCAEMSARLDVGDTTADQAYNIACCYSLAGQTDTAMLWLNSALRHGYHDAEWLQNDPDLSALHSDPRWADITAFCKAAHQKYLKTVNPELYHLFEADQAERLTGDIDWDTVSVHDRQRRARVSEMIADSALHVRDDYIHAAFIFQHGDSTADYALAHKLALRAVALDSSSTLARWIAAASQDRYLVSRGEPQWYGTQFYYRDDRWTIDPIDTVNITDVDRAYWCVPTLQEARQREAEMNGE